MRMHTSYTDIQKPLKESMRKKGTSEIFNVSVTVKLNLLYFS